MLNNFLKKIKILFSPLGVGGLLFLPTAYCLLPAAACRAQSDVLKYARQIIDTLCAPGMHGRGYVNKGDSIAADYIKREFEKLGIKPIGKEFEQRFSLSINTFFENPVLRIEKYPPGRFQVTYFEGKAGENYLIKSYSNSLQGLFRLLYIDSTNTDFISTKKFKKISKKSKGLFLLINYEGIKDKKYLDKKIFGSRLVGIGEVVPKLTHGVSSVTANFAGIDIDKHSLKASSFYEDIGMNKKIYIRIKNQFISDYQSKNILGYIKGTQYPDSFIVFSAHYDHLGRMGKDVYFPGANDNASGCAMLLNLAKYYSQHPPKYSVAFFAFGAEEAGLIGSKYYVEHPLFPLKQIKFLVNMDILGTGDEGIKVVNGTEHKKEFDELVKINSEKSFLPAVSPRGKAANSDHYFFEEAGVKTFFIYTLGGIKAYHDIYDRPETLPLTKFEEVYQLLLQFTEYLQN